MSDDALSILNDDGSCPEEYLDLVSDADLSRILELMIFNRALDRRTTMLQRQGRLGFAMTSFGEEAVTIGAPYCTRATDPIFLQYRELGALLWRGVDLRLILDQLLGNAGDLSKGRQMPVHYCFADWAIPSVSSPVGTQLPHACGYAYAAKLKKTNEVALAFLGEGTASQGDFHTALNFSGVFRVPAVFLIRNNGYAISTPENRQTAAQSLAARAAGYGMPGVRIDGNDLLAVVHVVRRALEWAREGHGPTLIEALTYRLGAHSSADDPSVYRSEDETRSWLEVDALSRLKKHAMWRGVWEEDREEEIKVETDKEITEALAECEKLPPPPVESLFDDVYETIPWHLQEEKNEYLHFLRKRNAERV